MQTTLIFKDVKTFLFDQIKLIQFDGKVVSYVFNSYPRGGKDYGMWKVESRGSNLILCKCITFNEFRNGGRVKTSLQ